MIELRIPEQIGMSVQDWLRAQGEQPFELIDGEKVQIMSTTTRHNLMTRALFLRLLTAAEATGAGFVTMKGTFALPAGGGWRLGH